MNKDNFEPIEIIESFCERCKNVAPYLIETPAGEMCSDCLDEYNKTHEWLRDWEVTLEDDSIHCVTAMNLAEAIVKARLENKV